MFRRLRSTLVAFLGALIFLTVNPVQAQDGGDVAGIVVSTWDASPVAGVVVTVRGSTLAAQTDLNGRYELKGVTPGDQVLRFSKSGFASAVVTDVRVLLGQKTTVNGNLRPEYFEMEEYEVTAEEFTDQTEQILLDRQESSAMVHSIGSEMFSKLGASSVADVATKVSGTTIVEGKYAVVRGLNDRYVPALLNGGQIPSSDPYRRSASLDQFPAGIVDQVAITKTFTPDQGGDSTGGSVNIITKQVPETDFINFKFGVGYNTQATGNDDYLTYDGGSTDWLGMDDGTRALPTIIGPYNPVPPARTLTSVPTNPNYQTQVDEANTLNAQTVALGTAQFEPHGSAPPPDQKLGLSFGKTFKVADQPAGVIAAFDYKREYRFDDDGVQNRYQGTTILNSSYKDARSLTTTAWAGMAGIGARLWEDHEIGFNVLYSQTSRDTARIQTGTNYNGAFDTVTIQDKIQWQERNMVSYQLQGSSKFSALNNLQLDYLLGMTSSSQDEPDTRFFNYSIYGTNGYTGENYLPDPVNPTRYYANLEEDGQQAKVDLTYPFEQWSDLEATIKGGFNLTSADRTYWERNLYYQGDAPWTGTDPNTYLTEDNLGYDPTPISAGRTRWNWQRSISAFDSRYTGSRDIEAAYLMTDIPVVESVRLVGGARVEDTDIQIHSESFTPSSITGERVNNTKLSQTDVLPAIGIIWSINKQLTLRANYSETVARPSFRELAAYRSYDPNLDIELEGNPTLEMSSIKNYDLALDWYPTPSSLISVGVFYKDLSQAIEQRFINLDGSIMTWENRDSADVIGVEFEARQRLDFLHESLKNFSLGGNVSFIESSTDLTALEYETKQQYVPSVDSTRPLSEQSPYIVNVDISYDNPKSGTILSVVYNIAGARLVAAALTTEDIYEQPAAQLDFIATQRLFKNAFLNFSAKNLLNPSRELTYGEDSGLIFSSYKTGTTYSIGLDFKF